MLGWIALAILFGITMMTVFALMLSGRISDEERAEEDRRRWVEHLLKRDFQD